MLLAVALIAMTLIVVTSVMLPLVRVPQAAPARARYDRAVYRSQLQELERDVARGTVAQAEASTARLEIERRLLATDGSKDSPPPSSPSNPLHAVVLALGIPAGAALIYLALGSPSVPDQPLVARAAQPAIAQDAPGHTDFAAAAAKLEQLLKENPDDPEKWLLLARTHAELSNWQKSADAYHRVIALMGGTPEVFAAYGEMLVMDAGGMVTPSARAAFEAAVAKDPTDVVARFYLGLGEAQSGNAAQAIEIWRRLAGDLPADSPLRSEVARRIGEVARPAGLAVPPLPPPAQTAEAPVEAPAATGAPGAAVAPGPTAQDVAAAQEMSAEDRQAMIRSMVARLAERLKSEPNDVDGWMRLGRAYGVLGERDKAIDAYEHADRLAQVDDQHREVAAAIAALRAK
jgi:cytochrome c-type biogenesis protein CcmH